MTTKLSFPKESVDLAQDVAQKYQRRSKSKLVWAANLFEGDFLGITYGFDEALRKGNCGPYLHEIVKEAECFTKSVSDYLVARELGLKPNMYWASDMKDLQEGAHPMEKGTMDHSFITVEARKGIEQMVDPFMDLWGETKFSKEENSLSVNDRRHNRIITRKYAALIKMTEQEILQKIEQNRSKAGGRLALSGWQRVKSNRAQTFVQFDPKTETLSTKISFNVNHPKSEPYQKSDTYKLQTKVNEDGTFDFNEGKFIVYYAGELGWANHVDEQEPMEIPVKHAQISWTLFDEIMRKTGKRKNAHLMSSSRLRGHLIDSGLNYDFSTDPNSLAESIIIENFQEGIVLLQEQQIESAQDFLERARKHEITWRVFLRDAQYNTEKAQNRSPENPYGFVHSFNEHEQLIANCFEEFCNATHAYSEVFLNSVRVKAKLKKGTNYQAVRERNKSGHQFDKESKFMNSLIAHRNLKFEPLAYNIEADRAIFFEQFNLEKDSIAKLEEGLTEEHLVKAGQEKLFDFLHVGATRRKSLFLKSFYPGLKKILDRT
jgi:hypothetical protein